MLFYYYYCKKEEPWLQSMSGLPAMRNHRGSLARLGGGHRNLNKRPSQGRGGPGQDLCAGSCQPEHSAVAHAWEVSWLGRQPGCRQVVPSVGLSPGGSHLLSTHSCQAVRKSDGSDHVTLDQGLRSSRQNNYWSPGGSQKT